MDEPVVVDYRLLELLARTRPATGPGEPAPTLGLPTFRDIDIELARRRLIRCSAQYRDIPDIDALLIRAYDGSPVATEVGAYETARVIDFGHIVLVRDQDGRLVGCVYCIRYGPALTYALRMAVDPEYASAGLGVLLFQGVIAASRLFGARAFCGLIDATNTKILHIALNRLGAVFYDVIREPIEGIENHYKFVVPLDPRTVRAPTGSTAVAIEDVDTAARLFADSWVGSSFEAPSSILFTRTDGE